MNGDTPVCERPEANYIQTEGYQNRNSHNSYSHQSHHDLDDSEKSLTELNNNVKNDLKISKDQNEKNFQTKYKDMERKMDEWEKPQNVSSEQTKRTDPSPPQAHTEQVNAVFTKSGKSDDSLKIQKDPSPPIIVNNKIKKDQLRHQKGTIT
ncbi:hypothetical protein Tco_0312330 [Tanacetum coccineum]